MRYSWRVIVIEIMRWLNALSFFVSKPKTIKNLQVPNMAIVARTRLMLSCFRLIPHIIITRSLQDDDLFRADIARWVDIEFSNPPSGSRWTSLKWFVKFMTFAPEFRNVFYLRHPKKTKLLRWLCPPLSTLQIECPDVGPGLYIQHGLSTLISARRIGANCRVAQQVTIGYCNKHCPSIGDNVTIHAGAKIIGNIKIGNNVTVGLNTVVLDDVPSDVSVLGVPARRIPTGPLRYRNWE